jgi:membrane protein YdbS with pleckstrin-like domain
MSNTTQNPSPAPSRSRRRRPVAFRGQRQGEQVIVLLRKHWWFLIKPGWPALLVLAAFIPLFALQATTPAVFRPVFLAIDLLLAALLLFLMLRWAYSDLSNWWADTYTVTNRRIIDSEGIIEIRRKEIPLDRIQQVAILIPHLWARILGYGDVVIRTAGVANWVDLKGVARPRDVQDIIRQAEIDYRSSAPPPPPPPELSDPVLARQLDVLAKPKDPPTFSSPDKPHRAGAPLGPTRRFGGPLRLESRIRYQAGEETVAYIQHHPYLLFRWEAPPVLVLLLLILLVIFLRLTIWPIDAALLFIALIWGTYAYFNFIDDVYILTTHRIIDVDRRAFIFFEEAIIAEYSKIQDIVVSVPTPMARSFDFGIVRAETAGALPDLEMYDVPHPFEIQNRIFQLINAQKEREQTSAANKQKAELKVWFSTMLGELIKRQAPNLFHRSLAEAMNLVHQHELSLRIDGERYQPGVAAGLVIAQDPAPGTLLMSNSEIHITLSRDQV